MNARRRLDRLTQRVGDTTGATDAYEAHERARLDAMTDEKLDEHIAVLKRALELVDAAGALDDVHDVGLDSTS